MTTPDTTAAAGPPRLVILGGGFAGVWAALTAAGTASSLGEADIRLVTPGDRFVPRPRLYEASPGDTTVPLTDILGPVGVEHVAASATGLDLEASVVTVMDADGVERQLPFDRLILATGSQLRRPPIDATHLHDIDTLEGAEALDDRLAELDPGATIVVVGAGFTGIELACELPARVPSAQVVLMDRNPDVGSGLGAGPRPEIVRALDELGVRRRTGVTMTSYDGTTVELADGTSLAADVVVWTAGMSASPLAAAVSDDLDPLGRLSVDQFLRVADAPSVLAAGDVAAPLDSSGHTVAQSAQHAIPQGACAGQNAIADMFGGELTELATLPYGTCLDLGAAGAVFTEGWDREVTLVGDEAKAIKHAINTEWLYPPVASRAG